MSSRRIAWSCAAMALVVAAGSWYAVSAFPLREAAQELRKEIGPLEKQAKPITPDNPVPRRTYSVDPLHPAEVAAVDANAMITLMITLDQFGRVAEIRRLGVAPIGECAGDPQRQIARRCQRARCARQVGGRRSSPMDVRPTGRCAALDSGDVRLPVQRETSPGGARRLVARLAGSATGCRFVPTSTAASTSSTF